jgi:hypothetical protein
MAAELERLGYCVVPGLLGPDAVQELRTELRSRFEAAGRPRFLRLSQLQDSAALMRLSFHRPLVRRLASVLGSDYWTIPDLCAQRDMYGVWHADSDPDGPRAELQRDDFAVVKCGIYLQNNAAGGGGLEVLEGAHRLPMPWAPAPLAYKCKGLRDRVLRPLRKQRVPLRAGDALIFDYRLPHISARPLAGHAATEKFVLYFNATAAASGRFYLEHMQRRAVREERGGREVFWSDSLWRNYPEDFPAAFVSAAESVQARVLVPSPDDAARWRNWYQAVARPSKR